MHAGRASEISQSPMMANVTYFNTQVYIQHVDEQRGTARIYPLDNPQQEQEVPLSQLTEH
ncbi:small acid-soluble spore protein H [Alteribacter natronophilus]|uniref:small acid-soluble spore protein H n=1 Tax=Alteribacter natronophilus TaxID=2583810 RepID=UPI00110F1343|nr:small acid-soluble spore protein H [Alteribacter natronophilus]TMW71014.1 small acid-soluble spore protein H [Alteribacter natronophilus]